MAEMFISVSELMHTVTLVVSVFFTPQRIITVNIFVFDVENPLLGLRIIVLRPVFDARVLAEIESFLLPKMLWICTSAGSKHLAKSAKS